MLESVIQRNINLHFRLDCAVSPLQIALCLCWFYTKVKPSDFVFVCLHKRLEYLNVPVWYFLSPLALSFLALRPHHCCCRSSNVKSRSMMLSCVSLPVCASVTHAEWKPVPRPRGRWQPENTNSAHSLILPLPAILLFANLTRIITLVIVQKCYK